MRGKVTVRTANPVRAYKAPALLLADAGGEIASCRERARGQRRSANV
jgi:hypothetical protein